MARVASLVGRRGRRAWAPKTSAMRQVELSRSRAPPTRVHLPVTRDFTASSRRSLPARRTEESDFDGPYEDRNDVSVAVGGDTEVGSAVQGSLGLSDRAWKRRQKR